MELPTRHIVIREHQRKLLQANVWSEDYVDAYLSNKGVLEPIKLKYRGGHTREYPKKSYEVLKGNKTVHLNAEYDDPSMIRNALSFQFFEMIGVPSPRTKHCLLKVNDENMGVYLEIEAVDHNFFKHRKIPVRSLVYAVNDSANFDLYKTGTNKRKSSLFSGYRLKIGKDSDRKQFKSFILNLNTLRDRSAAKYLFAQLDVDNYLRWLAGAVLTGNYDGFDQNYAMYRHKRRRKYRIIPWDYEGTWGRNCYGKSCGSDLVRVTGYNRLTEKLLVYPKVRAKYKEILTSILGSAFTEKKLMPIVEQMHGQIAPYIRRDFSRKWPYSLFASEPQFIRNYIRERRDIVMREISKWK